ncbi:hypothetical protein WKI65_37650 [Streptomyces sp. MS1.AVA.3]|uniref:hypothetical protein n=1 Tax=Streptomyces decoyicus TaxID=249567 RepID=UPI0030C2CA21
MTAPAAEPPADTMPYPIHIPACGTVPLKLFRARLDRRNVITIGDSSTSVEPSLVAMAIEEDGALSRQFFSDRPSPPPISSVSALDEGTLRLVQALSARQAAARGEDHVVDSFATEVIGRRGARWREAVSTALLGDWATPLLRGDRLATEAVSHLKTEAERLHRQLMPLWRRRTHGSRLLLLDTPLGDGLSLYDLLVGCPGPGDTVTDAVTDDARLGTVLRALRQDERAVALAWAHNGAGTWAEAALYAGADDPVAFGERVRRKLKRLAVQERTRAAAAARTRGVAP